MVAVTSAYPAYDRRGYLGEASSVLRKDVCDVYEMKPYAKENGSTGFKREAVYRDLPCRVSYSKGRAVGDGGSLGETRQDVKLFLSAEYEIKAGSVIVVKRKNINTAYKNSSPPAVYSAHQEICLELYGELDL